MASKSGTKDVQFYEFTGQTLVYPITCKLHDFQREIIKSSIFCNTLISLPPGLGKSLIAAVITFNFHRWFTRGKIVVLSQTRSYLTDQISAYNSYTTLSDETFAEIPANATDEDCQSVCELPIVLSSPQKFLYCLEKNFYRIQSLILLVVLETTKISKCQEYQEITSRINIGEFRILTLIDPVGMNSKIIKQIVEMFGISKMEIKNVDSPEIRTCTFSAEIESIVVDVSRHILSIKDAFYTVFEKYGKKLKDAKLINGNVVTLTRIQLQKHKEKFLKNPPMNSTTAQREDLVNSMTMCGFLCHGIELLHNWGVRAFYLYLFDTDKDDNLKNLIKNDELLTEKMNFLDEYLKPNGKKIDSTLSRITHPKLLKLKSTVSLLFSDSEENISQLRIVIICSVECVISDIEQLFSSLPDVVRCQFVKTKVKCLSNDPLYKETIENFVNGVMNVLVITNLVDEITEIKSTVIISLEPIKPLFRLSDPRFQKTADKCLFIITKGSEENKFETLLHEKRHEQKPLDVSKIDESSVTESSNLFPEGFDPIFECSSVKEVKKTFRNSPGQKSLLQFFNSKLAASSPAAKESGANKKLKTSKNSLIDESRSIFADDFDSTQHSIDAIDEPEPAMDSYFEDPIPYLPNAFINPSPVAKTSLSNVDDSFDDLILDFASDLRDSKLRDSVPAKNTSTSPSLVTSATSPVLSSRSKSSWFKRNSQKSSSSVLKPLESDCSHVSNTIVSKSPRVSLSKKSRSCDIGLEDLPNVSFVDDLFSDSSNSDAGDHESEKSKKANLSKDNRSTVDFPEESFGDFVFSGNSGLNQQKTVDPKVTTSAPKKAIPSSLFTSARNLNNNDSKTLDAQKRSLERPLFSDGEDDLFDDVSWLDSNKKSAQVDSYDRNKSETSFKSNIPNSVPTYPPKSMSTAFDSSSDFSRLNTIEGSTIPEVSLTEIPSEFMDDFVPASPPREAPNRSTVQKFKSCSLETSPVLFSLKKSNRKLFSSLRCNGDQKRTPLKFDSLFDVSKENLQQPDKKSVAVEDKENDDEIKVVPSTPPATDCEFDSILFDDIDDLFINDITNKGSGVANQVHKEKTGVDKSQTKGDSKIDPLNTSSTSPSLFEMCNYDTTNKSSYVEATVTMPVCKKSLPSKSPIGQPNGTSLVNKTSTPIRDTSKNKISFRKRSTPLFDESDNRFRSPRPHSNLRPAMQGQIEKLASSSEAEKKRLYSSFTESIKKKLSISGGSNDDSVSRVEETKVTDSKSIIDTSDDDFPWLRKKSPVDRLNGLACFKKPEESMVKSRYFSHRVTPGTRSILTDCNEVVSTPTPPNATRQKKKRSRLKRNLAEQFIDAEAEVTDDDEDDNEDCYFTNDCQLSDDSFIDDDTNTKPENISKYLKFIKSPDIAIGKFHIPVLTDKQMRVNVYSQAPECDQAYENDSFCVDEDEPEPDDAYIPSVLTQMEERLSKRKEGKVLPKTKQFKRIRIIDDSSPDSPTVRQNQRKRIKRFSSDSED